MPSMCGCAVSKARRWRAALYKAVYESDHWKKEIAPRIPDLLDREKMVVTRIVPTTRSTVQ